ncbi:hypothetical protein [Subtercola boreus]|nr:hypothetical protein [Subtercola boreus]TQL54522.1 hypothetical protein FB464_2061 [Subtercola boreus]
MTDTEPKDADNAAAPAPTPDAAKRELQDELDSIRATGEDLHG